MEEICYKAKVETRVYRFWLDTPASSVDAHPTSSEVIEQLKQHLSNAIVRTEVPSEGLTVRHDLLRSYRRPEHGYCFLTIRACLNLRKQPLWQGGLWVHWRTLVKRSSENSL